MIGSVTLIRADRGFCFLQDESGEQSYFLHATDLEGANATLAALRPGSLVSFDAEDGPKGKRAVRAKLA